MKKMNYKKPLAEVMDLEVTDILTTSGTLDGYSETTLTGANMYVNGSNEVKINSTIDN